MATAGVKMQHVPYRGNGQAVAALLAGEVQVLLDSLLNARPHIQSGRVTPLAVSGAARSPFPEEFQVVLRKEVAPWRKVAANAKVVAE